MHTTNDLLDAVKQKYGISSDYKLRTFLGVSQNTLPNYRHGRSRPDDDMALKLADLLELDPLYVIACVNAERAQEGRLQRMWEALAKRSMKGAVVVALVGLGVTGGPDGGAMASSSSQEVPKPFIM